MSHSSFSASAPGSLMLLGEHAVLHGRRALVCAIDKRITVLRSQINNPILRIVSDLGTYEAPLGELTDHPDFRFVLDAVKQYPLDPSFAKGYGGHGQGIELKIESEFSSDIGFGSSAAVTVATHAAMMQLNSGSLGEFAPPGRATPPAEPFKMELFKRSLATIHRVQGRGSGADVAASVFGGVVAYRAEPLEIHKVVRGVSPIISSFILNDEIIGLTPEPPERPESFPLTAVYSGAKMKTADVIRLVEERRALNPAYYEKIFDRMDASVGEVIGAFPMLGKNLILNQKLMEEMGLCNAALAEIIRIFQTLETPAKISGSGLGDCAIGLGTFSSSAKASADRPTFGNFLTYPLQVSDCGVRCC